MKIALIVPWFSDSGGAEIAARQLAENFLNNDCEVEVLTTCCKSAFCDWSSNDVLPGEKNINGIKVRYFKTNVQNKELFQRLNLSVLSGDILSIDEEELYLSNSINSDDLVEYIKQNADAYDFFVMLPYLYGLTYFASKVVPEKTIIFPCLHDEPNAYFQVYREMFLNVKYCMFLSEAEGRLYKKLYGLDNGEVVGLGVNPIRFDDNLDIRDKFDLKDDYILYLGRKVAGKGIDLLLDNFLKYKKDFPKSSLKLVICGKGELERNFGLDDGIVDLGFVTNFEKYALLRSALFLCNPSYFESFSIVLMEAWLAKVPVLVNEKCDVTKEHCISSDGGLYFESYRDYQSCINFFLYNPRLRKQLAVNGHQYVVNNYDWSVVMNKIISKLNEL